MADRLDALKQELETLRREFELYFMGHEKRIPAKKRDRLKRDIHRFDPGHDAVLRFKHKNLVQRWMVAERYWDRILRAIEEGRYERDVRKANLRESWRKKEKKPASPEAEKKATVRAKEVGDEAEAFMAALSGKKPSPPLRGAPVGGAPRAPMRGRPVGKDAPPVPMRGRPVAPPRGRTPSTPPRAPRPSGPPRPQGRPSPSGAPRPAPPREARRPEAPAPRRRPPTPPRPGRPAPPKSPSPPDRGGRPSAPPMRGRPLADPDERPLRVPLRGRPKTSDD